ncbi:MAG: dihydroorotase, partial [Pseudomonadota bacterium]
NDDTITLRKTGASYPSQIDTEDGPVTVFDPGFALNWAVI